MGALPGEVQPSSRQLTLSLPGYGSVPFSLCPQLLYSQPPLLPALHPSKVAKTWEQDTGKDGWIEVIGNKVILGTRTSEQRGRPGSFLIGF